MGRELQKRKNRSSRPKVRSKQIGRTKGGNKKVNFLGNAIIAKNWDRSLTLEQNYKRLGLSTKLSNSTGGIELRGKENLRNLTKDSLAINSHKGGDILEPKEVEVERDPDTGRIIRIISQSEQENPLNDPLNEIEDTLYVDGSKPNTTNEDNIIAQLEDQAAQEAKYEKQKKRPRQQSEREEEWIASLVAKHGDDVDAMFRDKKLNPMQQSKGDIARRIKKWRQKHG